MLTVNVEICAGERIEIACREAAELATKLGTWVQFNFNGVECHAAPNCDPDMLAAQQQLVQSQHQKYPMAFAHSVSDRRAEHE